MRSNAILRIVLYSIAIIVLLGILIGGIAVGLYVIDVDGHHSEVHHTPIATDRNEAWTALDVKEIQNIKIDWVSGSITIEPDSTSKQIVVKEIGLTGEDTAMVCKRNGDTLEIEYQKETDFVFGMTESFTKDLIITVPMGWVCDTLVIDTASAEVTVSDLVIEKFDFDGASGVCRLQNCCIDKIDMDTASGNIYFEGTLNALDCDAASASCEIVVNNVPEYIEMEMASGDLNLTLPENCGFTVDLSTASGQFASDFETTCKDDSHTHSVHTHGDGSCHIEVNAMSGDVTIHKAPSAPTATIPYCQDPNCTDPNHDHSAVCTDEDCTLPHHSNHH